MILYIPDTGSVVLNEFERVLGFKSLRTLILEEENKAFANGTWSFENDPDNHFISDSYLRTMLNEELELKVGNEYIKYLDEYRYVWIFKNDYGSLEKIRNNPSLTCGRLREVTNAAVIFTQELNASVIGGTQPEPCTIPANACNPDFYVDPNYYNGLTVDFINTSNAVGASSFSSVTWDFGDGSSPVTTNTALDQTHTFPAAGSYNVCLTLAGSCLNDPAEYCQQINVELNCPNAGFTWSRDQTTPRKYDFTNQTSLTSWVDYYEWDFGDGSTITQTSFQTLTSHTYSNDGSYVVTLTAYSNNCSPNVAISSQIDVIEASEACCDYNDRSKERRVEYALCSDGTSGVRAIKCKLWSGTLLGIYNYYGASTTHYKRKNDNCSKSWKKTKADRLEVLIYGSVWDATCTQELIVSSNTLVLDLDEGKNNSKKVKASDRWGFKAGLKTNSLKSLHYASDYGDSITHELSITNKTFDDGC